VLGRAPVLLLAALAFACPAAFPASSSADVGPEGWGISDDFHVPSIALDETFDELEPKSFRLIASWEALGDPGYVAQIESRIDEANAAARATGGMEIAVSFARPPQIWQDLPLTGQAWIDQVRPFIDRFSSEVDWWGPMNEPALKGWTFTPSGASFLADVSVRLKSYLEQSHPDDRLLSPDFNDHYNADDTLKRHADGTSFVERYVKLFDRAGGQFGSAVSWHPYGAVRRRSFLSTDDLVTTLSATKGAGLPIWVTEAGAHVNDNFVPGQTEAEQDAQVKWLSDTIAGLASHDSITRMHYYNVRQEVDVGAPACQPKPGFPWDSGLVRACGDRRPAWYTWCLASRAGDAACYDDSPGAASWGPSRLDVFWRGQGDDAAIYRRSWDGSLKSPAWSAPGSLGGSTTSSPAVAAPAAKRLEVYTRGLDNSVWHRRYDGSAWSGWSGLGGKTYASPAASARRGTSVVDVFLRGTDNEIYHRYRDGIGWSLGWMSIGSPTGGATSAPAAVSNGTGRIEVFVRGADSAIWRRTWTGAWGPWTSVGGAAASAPAVASRGTGRLDLFVRGTDGQVYRSFNDGTGWSPWSSLGGATSSAPAAAAPSSSRIDVWARGPNGMLQHKVWQAASGWSGWSESWFTGPRR
jgi:Glycosyl hydrolase catalytic core